MMHATDPSGAAGGPDAYVGPAALRASGAGPAVLDVRDADEHAAGHPPGAWHPPGDELPRRLAQVPRGRPVVTVCTMRHRLASRSERAAALLRGSGPEARALDGGFPAWAATGYPVERGA